MLPKRMSQLYEKIARGSIVNRGASCYSEERSDEATSLPARAGLIRCARDSIFIPLTCSFHM